MARYIGPVCRLCRREDQKLFLKGERCFSEKCAYDRRQYPPGQHGQGRRRRPSDYGHQLREKQKVKRMYGLLEKQFRGYYYKAARMKGITGENLLSLLERRLDNVAVRCGFASSHAEARQLVRHGHFTVNGVKINIPSYLVHEGDEIVVREKSRKIQKINESLAKLDRSPLPQWIEIDRDAYKGKIKNVPARSDISADIDEQLIVELYSK
jgi:small subunit ribosomal protein S4